jgi:hypothetical protein
MNLDTKLLQVDNIFDSQVIKLELLDVIANGGTRKSDCVISEKPTQERRDKTSGMSLI